MSYAILINPYTKELKLTKTVSSFKPPKEIIFKPFFNREREHDEVFFIFENGELKKLRGLYVVIGKEINDDVVKKIEKKIVWCGKRW